MEADWLSKWNHYMPGKTALTDGHTGRQWTYSEFFKIVNAVALRLQQFYKIQKGDRVALLSANELESVALFFATSRLGALLVPINHRLSAPEIDYILDNCGAKLLVHSDEYVQLSQQKKNTSAQIAQLLGAGGLFSDLQWGEMVEFSAQFADPAMILYTSGTTGFPKGAVLTHQGLFWNSVNTTLRLNLSQDDISVNFAPLFHTGGWNVLLTPFIHRGAHTILLKRFDSDLILELLQSYKCTLFFGVPTTLDMMVQSKQFEKADLSSIRYAIVGGEPMPIPLIQQWHQKGIPVRQGYGLTEFGPNVFSLNEEHALTKIGSIGFPNFYIQTKVVTPEGSEAKAGEVGELLLRGPMIMQGYWNNAQATAETIKDGWLSTGDLVRHDQDGFFYVVGRKKEMYISGGENIYPAEVEHVLRSHPSIREAAVIGVRDEKWGEVGCAFVVNSQELHPEQIADYCRERLAKFKVPKHFRFLSALPKGDSGKILKKELQKSF
ncbi:MAG: long-chain fatty acid--CoA ligase [Bdellovibrionales bacterium]|nr:long-chain fatty acid--CoA ligase [Bdellovibrionales bacterium]